MDVIVHGETAKAAHFSATWEDFKARSEDTKVREWQEAYFNLMSINNTYSVFYEMRIMDYRVSQGVYSVRFYLTAKESFRKNIRDWLEDHFTTFNEDTDTIILAELWDVKDDRGREVEDCIMGIYEG